MLSGTGDVGPSVSSLTILRPVPNVGVVYDQFGNTASIYDQRGVRRSGGKPYSASLRSVHAFRLPRGPCLAYDHVAITAPSRCLCAMDSSSNLALQY